MKASTRSSLPFLVFLVILQQISALQTPTPSTKTFIKDPPSPFQVASIYFVAPAVPAIVLPILTDAFRTSQDPTALLTVLVAKRGFIYLIAILSTAYAGWRATTSLPAGESLDSLNRQILQGEAAPSESQPRQAKEEKQLAVPEEKEKEDEAVFAVLDEMEDVGQNLAFALPFVLATALSISYFMTQGSDQSAAAAVGAGNIDILAAFSSFSTFSNLAICLLFSAAEYRSCAVSNEDDDDAPEFPLNIISLPNIAALLVLLAASLLPLTQAWPFQNSINIALAVTVTRALAPFLLGESGSIRTIALALTGLAAYDVISVFGTSLLSIQAAGAFDAGIASSSVIDLATSTTGFAPDNLGIETSSLITAAGDTSVMETVARAKLEGPWRPGLLEMVLVGRVSDVIGLGDIVFPACLVSWGFALNMSYASATIGGYILGSLLTEVASTLGPNQGLPALIFIAPAMLATVSLVAIQRGEMAEIWGYAEDADGNNSSQD
jgi:hypothetical protein